MTRWTPARLDELAGALLESPHIAALSEGTFGTAASYLPGRRIPGLRVLPDGRLEVHVVMAWGSTVDDVEAGLLRALEDPQSSRISSSKTFHCRAARRGPRSLPGRGTGRDSMTRCACGRVAGRRTDCDRRGREQPRFDDTWPAHHPDHGGDGTHVDEAVTARRVLLRTTSAPTRHRHFYTQRSWWRHLTARRSR